MYDERTEDGWRALFALRGELFALLRAFREKHGLSVRNFITLLHGVAWDDDDREQWDGRKLALLCYEIGEDDAEPTPAPIDLLVVMGDERWAGTPYGPEGCPTIGAMGCWLCTCAMAQRWYGIDPAATPVTADHAIGPGGYADCQMTWEAMKVLGLRVLKSTADQQRVRAHLAGGDVAFVDMYAGASKHFCLVTRCEDGRYWALDPLRGQEGWLDEQYDTIDSWRLVARVEESPIPPPPPTPLLLGLHDEAGGQWMKERGLRGACLVHEIVRTEARALDYRYLQEAGITVICRLNWGYADGTGTMPWPEHLDVHLDALAATMRDSLGVDYWHPWNETNNRQERPGFGGADEYALTKEYVISAYNRLRVMVPGVRLGLPPLDPYYGPGDDNMVWWEYFLTHAEGMDAIFLHGGKTQTNDPASVWSEAKFSDDPLRWQYLNARSVEPYLARIPVGYQHLPVFLTEMNPQRRSDGTLGWDRDNGEWVRQAVAYLREVRARLAPRAVKFGGAFYRNDEAGDQAGFGLCRQPMILAAIEEAIQ